MLQEIKAWPSKIKDGLQIAHDFHFEHKEALPRHIKKIIFLGMGGSGISGRIIKTFLDKRSSIPSFIIDGPDIPAFVDSETLAFVVSYSGNTWEVVEGFNKLVSKHIPTIVISNNGKLLEIAEEKNIFHMLAPQSVTPRSALGTFLGIQLCLLDLMGILPGKNVLSSFQKHLELYIPKLEDEAYYKEFLDIAKDKEFFHIWGIDGDSDAFAFRAQTQFNENAKVRATYSSVPELCHNLLVGFTEFKEKPLVLLFSTNFLSPSLETAVEALSDLLQERGVSLYKPPVLGDNWEEQLLHVILWSDFASYYLAKIRGCDPEPVVLIDQLKAKYKQKTVK